MIFPRPQLRVQHSEPAILALLDAGQLAEAASAIVRGLGPELFGYIFQVVRDEDAAREIFARFSEQLWRALPRFRRASTVRTWAYSLAWNCVAGHFRDTFRRKARPLEWLPISREVQAVCSTRSVERRDHVDRLGRLRAHLSAEERTLLVLRYDRDLGWDEIAEVLGRDGDEEVTAAALRKRFERLKLRLRQLITAEQTAAP